MAVGTERTKAMNRAEAVFASDCRRKLDSNSRASRAIDSIAKDEIIKCERRH